MFEYIDKDVYDVDSRGCPSCGYITETIDEWAHHMVSMHNAFAYHDDSGDCYLKFEGVEAQA